MTFLSEILSCQIGDSRLTARPHWSRGGGLIAALIFCACDSGPVDPQQSEARKLAEVRLEFDIQTQNVRTTVIPHAETQAQRTSAADVQPSFDENLQNLLQPSNTFCVPCNNGVLGLHDVGVTLTNSGLFNLSNLRVAGYATTGIDSIYQVSSPPTVLAPNSSFQQNFRLRVTNQRFGITFLIYGDP